MADSTTLSTELAAEMASEAWPALAWSDLEACAQFDLIACSLVIGGMALLGMIGNGLSGWVLRCYHAQSTTVTTLQALAISDSVLLCSALLVYTLPALSTFATQNEAAPWLHELTDAVDFYVWPVAMTAHTCTVLLTVLVSLTRYWAVCCMVEGKEAVPEWKVRAYTAVVFLFSVVFNVPRYFEHHSISLMAIDDYSNHSALYTSNLMLRQQGDNASFISINLGDVRAYQIAYSNVLYFVVMYLFPFAALAYLNLKLVRTERKVRMIRMHRTTRPVKDNITHIVVCIVVVFVVCQTPALVNQALWAVGAPECGSFHFYFTRVCDVLVVLNSSSNFVVYSLLGRSFRQTFVESLRGGRKRTSSATSRPLLHLSSDKDQIRFQMSPV